ncbi:MAG: hypothetical protein H6873_01830 [Hyphomicrobiaceae bacterium]|nr:hypothetical protein [Hyphomicrobiaceae bacterium]
MSLEAGEHLTLGQRLDRLARRIDDGAVLRAAFYLMLIATVSVIGVDYYQRQQMERFVPQSPAARPILPAAPRFDPAVPNEQREPQSEVTTDPDLLAAPMAFELLPDGVLLLQGTIQPDSGDQLLAELGQHAEYIKRIELDSPGGVVEAALMMGRLIREGEFPTSVGAGHFCASSCPLVLAGGAVRTLDPKSVIGVHQIYAVIDEDVRSPAEAMSDAQATTAEIGRYLDDMGIDPKLWFHALETPPSELYYLTPEEMASFGLSFAGSAESQS